MTIPVHVRWGFDDISTEGAYSRYERARGLVGYFQGVDTGLVVSAATGRQVSVSSGLAVVCGALAESDAAGTLTLDANAGSSARVDYIVLEVNWAGAGSASIKAVKGSSSTPPALTQTPGSLWQMPLARVTVGAGATTLTSANVEGARPLPRVVKGFPGTIDLSQSVGREAAPKTVGSVSVADPGWPYTVRVTAAAPFSSAPSGYARLVSEVVNRGATTRLEIGQSPALAAGGASAQLVGRPSDVLTGPSVVNVQISAFSMQSGHGPLSLNAEQPHLAHFTVERIPA